MLIVTLLVGFLSGVLAVFAAEILGFLFLIRKLRRKVDEENDKIRKTVSSAREDPDFSFTSKQGWIWILAKEKIPKKPPTDRGSNQQKRKIEALEVSPVKKYAKIKHQLLALTESDGTITEIRLLGCKVEAVSATNLPSRKWAKKYPIKVESEASVIYHESKLFYIYVETSSEKESWCKALRLASFGDKEKLTWFVKLRSEFHDYLTSLNVEYPSFLKPSIGFVSEIVDKSIKVDGSSSKVRHFLKKIAKKASKSGVENRANWPSVTDREERKIFEKSQSVHEPSSVGGSLKPTQTGKIPKNVSVENLVQSSSSSGSTHSGSRSQFPITSETDSVDKTPSDEGTLCWNLLVSRLFFDAKSNAELRNSLQARIQRTLSNMRTPSYIGEVVCTGVDPGNLPPYIHAMRVLPSDLKEVVTMEVDIEYYGGVVLDIETRLEVRELDGSESGVNSDSIREVTSDLLEGFEYNGEQLQITEGTVQATEHTGDRIPNLEESRNVKHNGQSSSSVSKWKSLVNSVAKQVSQVPLSLAIRVSALRGTLRFYIKPPPSDQLWFGFTSMPDIDFHLESSVGDRKITSGHIALFLISRFKTAIRETMVLPNCENLSIPWMLAEKDDWVPQKVAPYIWVNQESVTESSTAREVCQETDPQETRRVSTSSSIRSTTESIQGEDLSNQNLSVADKPLDELRTPLLASDQPPLADIPSQSSEEDNRDVQLSTLQHPSPSRQSSGSNEEHDPTVNADDPTARRTGTRARMQSLRKRMGEKLEEKKRSIEERGRHIVEKMRGP